MKIFTIGHSTRPIEEFLELLRAHHITLLADVRTIPGSRRNPQYSQSALERSLSDANIQYRWFKDLGGLRKARPDSINTGWRNASFRGYADYMQTDKFKEALNSLIEAAYSGCAAIMCAEAVQWKCHRSLISDALEARGIEVSHIHTATSAPRHRLTAFAVVRDGNVSYPA